MNLITQLHHYKSDAVAVGKNGHVHLLKYFLLFLLITKKRWNVPFWLLVLYSIWYRHRLNQVPESSGQASNSIQSRKQRFPSMFSLISSWRLLGGWAHYWLPKQVPSFSPLLEGWGLPNSAWGLWLFWCSRSNVIRQENRHLSQITQVCVLALPLMCTWVSKKGKQKPRFLSFSFGIRP